MLSQNVKYYIHILRRLNLNCNIPGLKLQVHLLDIMFSQLVVQSMRATKENNSKLVTQLKLSMTESLFIKRMKGRPHMEIVFGTALVLIHFFLLIVIVWSTFKVPIHPIVASTNTYRLVTCLGQQHPQRLDFLNSNTCQWSRLYGSYKYCYTQICKKQCVD